jgi:hypothetical protein
VRDFERLGIRSVSQLAKQEPMRMYRKLERLTEQPQDPCVLDVFCAAIAQARNPLLSIEQSQWWWWSRKRKAEAQQGNAKARKGPRKGPRKGQR